MTRKDIIAHVKRVSGMTVQTGPFAGMRMHDVQTWGNGDDIGPQLLGVYEQELHPALLGLIAKGPRTVVNVGCAEGYYAVGLARLLPNAHVYAFDIDERAQAACRANAALNDVADRISVAGACSPDALAAIAARDPNILAVVDCEGAEVALLCAPVSLSSMRAADILVETHLNGGNSTAPALMRDFFASHRLNLIRAGARNPHAFAALDEFSDLDKWLLVCENRPVLQIWLTLEARNVAPGPYLLNVAGQPADTNV